MTLTIRNKLFYATLVLRHRWERKLSWEKQKFKTNFELGVWLKTYKAVGNAKGPIKFVFSANNSVRGYMFGVNLIVCKFWIDITSPKILLLKTENEINENEENY